VVGDGGDLVDGSVESFAVSLRRGVEAGQLRTNWSAASRISSSVAGGSKLNSVLMLRHIEGVSFSSVP
jgi:hypothetical protein